MKMEFKFQKQKKQIRLIIKPKILINRLKYVPKPSFKVCVLGDEKHCDEARANNIPCMTIDDLKKLNKNKKLVNKLGKI